MDTIDREIADKILQATGLEISFELGQQMHRSFSLGKGNFGAVRLAKQPDGSYVAIKIVKGTEIVEEEARIQQDLSGLPHLMPAFDAWTSGEAKDKLFYQVMPLAGLGELHKVDLSQLDTIFKKQVLVYLATQMLTGLAAMHQKGYFHADLKADNMVLDREANLQIIDFGCSEAFNGLYRTRQQKRVYVDHISPEYFFGLNGLIPEKVHDPRKFDSWALGMTLLRLINKAYQEQGEHPFCFKQVRQNCRSYKDYQKILESIVELRNPKVGSIEELIRGLLAPDPHNRPTPEEALLQYTCFQEEQPDAVQAYLKELVQHQRRGSCANNIVGTFTRQLSRRTSKKPGLLHEKIKGW